MAERRRPYRLGKRAEGAEATRRRIVMATLTLHDEQGITATSVRDIAARAAVAPSTVLQHFPRMSELIRACGELTAQIAPMPDLRDLASLDLPAERVERMARLMFEWWQAFGPGLDHLRTDRRHLAEVDAWFADVAHRHRALAAAALGTAGDEERVTALVAITTPDAWAAFHTSGLSAAGAASHVTGLLCPHPDSKEATR